MVVLSLVSLMLCHVAADDLRTWVQATFVAVGMPEQDARLAARLLVQTSLWGIDSHGVARVGHYLERLTRRSITAAPQLGFERSASGTGTVDGGHGLGLVVSAFAMDRAIELAREAGIGAVGVRNSSHCGAVGLYARQATAAGMIGLAFTHSDAFVIPHGGKKKYFGTNPIALAIPSGTPDRPLCVDLATSIVPWNRIANAKRENRQIASGLAVDEQGNDTTDPHRVAAVRPMAEHKGYALAFAIDMLCGPLNGMKFGPHLTPMYTHLDELRRLGSFMIAIDPQRFGGGAAIALAVAAASAELKQEGALTPGDPEYRCAEERTRTGVPIEPGLRAEFAGWAERLQVPLPSPLRQ